MARGAPDPCDRGCDRWSAVEGQINSDAASCFKTFIKRQSPADVFFLARRQSRTADFYWQHAASIVRRGLVAATQGGVLRADRSLSDHVFKMGIEDELLHIAKTTRFEDMHVLTRDQIFKFGIDPREFVEALWAFENLGRADTKIRDLAG